MRSHASRVCLTRSPVMQGGVRKTAVLGLATVFLLFAGARDATALQANEMPLALEAHRAFPDTLPLTLDEALRRAVEHNPGYRQAAMDLERNRLDRRQGWLELLPQPQFDVYTTSLSRNRQTVTTDNFGEPLERDVTSTIQTSRARQNFGVNFRVDLGDILEFRGHEDQAQAREYQVSDRLRDLRSDVRRAFLEVQEQQEALELEEELLAMARENRDLARRLYGLARRDRIDLVSLELDMAEQEDALARSLSELEGALLTLRNVVGDPELGEFRIVPVELETFDPERLDVEALVGVARATSPGVRQAEANLRVEERSMRTVRSRQWLPTLTFSWRTTRDGFVRGTDSFFDLRPDAPFDRNLFFQIEFPDLGQYFRRQNQEQRSGLAVRELEQGLRATRNELEQEVRQLVNELRASARVMANQERRAELAAEQVELTREAYRLGRISYIELLGAQEQSAQAGRQTLNARFSFQRDRVALERALGMSVQEMLELDRER